MVCVDVHGLGLPSDTMKIRDTSKTRHAVLIVANGYPSIERPWKCPFNHRAVKAIEQFWNPSVVAMRAWLPWRRAREFSYDGIGVCEVLVLHVPNMHLVWSDYRDAGRFGLQNMIMTASIGSIVNQIRKSANGIEVIHSIAAGRHAFAAQQVADDIGAPHIVQLIGGDVTKLDKTFARSTFFQSWLKKVNYFIANSRSLQTDFEKKTGISPPIKTIYRGVDTTVFTPNSDKRQLSNNDVCQFLYLGGNIQRVFDREGTDTKGADVLLRAWNLIEQEVSKEAKLLIGGPMIDDSSVQRFLQSLRYPERVTCLGALPTEDVPRVIRQADVLVIPSRKEGLPNICLEAMACGVPVVAAAVGGLPEVIQPGINGVLVPPDDVDALATAMINLLHNPSRISQLGVKAREHVVAHFDSRDYGSKLSTIYNASIYRQESPDLGKKFKGRDFPPHGEVVEND